MNARDLLAKLFCWLGFHMPSGVRPHGYIELSHCQNCGCELVRDNHWIQGDNKWINTSKWEERHK